MRSLNLVRQDGDGDEDEEVAKEGDDHLHNVDESKLPKIVSLRRDNVELGALHHEVDIDEHKDGDAELQPEDQAREALPRELLPRRELQVLPDDVCRLGSPIHGQHPSKVAGEAVVGHVAQHLARSRHLVEGDKGVAGRVVPGVQQPLRLGVVRVLREQAPLGGGPRLFRGAEGGGAGKGRVGGRGCQVAGGAVAWVAA